MRTERGLRILALAALALVLAGADPPPRSADPKTLGREVVRLVAEHFHDRARGNDWATSHNGYADAITDPRAFAIAANAALADLKTSHTRLYTRDEVAYYGLMAIFAPALKQAPPTFESIGVDYAEGHVIRRVFAGGPAGAAGLKRGDQVVGADQRPFAGVGAFRGQSSRAVILAVRRRAEGPLVEVRLRPRAGHRIPRVGRRPGEGGRSSSLAAASRSPTSRCSAPRATSPRRPSAPSSPESSGPPTRS